MKTGTVLCTLQIEQMVEVYMSILRRVLVSFLVLALPAAAMIAYILAWKKAEIRQQQKQAAVSFGTRDWSIFRGDGLLTGRAAGSLPMKLAQAWQFKTGGAVKSTPVVYDGIVYVSSSDKHVYALDVQTGGALWQTELDGEIEASPLVHGGRVYVGTLEGTLFALDGQMGEVLWSFKSGDKIVGSVNTAVVDGQTQILLGGYDGSLYALETDGVLLWKYETDSYINGTPAVFDGQAAVGGCDAFLHLVPLNDPNGVRRVDTGSYVPSSPAVLDGMAYVGNFEGKLLAIDTAKAQVAWTYENKDASFFAVPAVRDDLVVAGTREGLLIFLDCQTGKEVRNFRAGDAINSGPVLCGDEVLFGCDDGRLYRVSIQTGKEVATYNLGRPILSSPAIADNYVLVGCDDGSVYAFKQEEQLR